MVTHRRKALVRYGAALLITLSAGLLTFLFGRVLQPVPLLLFLTAVVASSRLGGVGPGIAATAIGVMLGDRLLGAGDEVPGWERFVRLSLFTLLSLLICWVGENLRQARRALEQREQLLLEADRRKDEFLAMLAHELRNPLAAISNAAYLLDRTDNQHPQAARFRRSILHQTRHLTRLVDDLLDVGRITAGTISLRTRRLDLAEVLRASVDAAQPLISRQRHQLSVLIPPVPLIVEGDPDRLEQVVTNLLTNAARYTEPGGRIWLEAQQEGSEITIRVRDTGVGIPREMLDRIFEPFQQVDGPVRTGGMGLGLAIARTLVTLHRGTIRAVSAGAGQGSEFIVQLPASVEPAVPAQETSPLAVMTPHRVLVVDDNSEAAETLAELLELWGEEAQIAFCGEQALETAARWQPDTVLLDLRMQGMDGYEVARRLRRHQPSPRLIALTGCGHAAEPRAREAGFDALLAKPVDAELLRQLLAVD